MDQNRQPRGGGERGGRAGREREGPRPPGKTRWDLGVTASITSPLTNEQFTETTHLTGPRSVVLAVNLGTIQSAREGWRVRGGQRVKKRHKRRNSELLLCLQIRVRLKYGI